MNPMPTRWLAAASLAACLAAGCTTGRLHVADAVVRGAQSDGAVTMLLTPSDVRTGDQLQVAVRNSQPGYLYLYQLGTDGKSVSLLFPNAIDGANYVAPGITTLPRETWKLTARGPAGVGYFLAVVAAERQDLTAIESRASAGRIETEGPYAAAMAMLRERQP